MIVSATIPTDPKMIPTPAIARSPVHARSGSPVSSRTSLNPTVVRVITVM